MRVLVPGGAGYIGSHTCKALAQAGHVPIVYDNLRTGHAWSVKWGPLEQGDINDPVALSAAMRRHRPNAVMNFAALAYIAESTKQPIRYYRANVGGIISLIEAMRTHDVSSMIFSSTCATYGIPARLPIAETEAQAPINPYGRSKLMAEEILRDACATHGLGAVALRYFNAAGADPEGELGEEHDPEPHLVPAVLQAAVGLRPPVPIFGTDYDTPDGTCVRDYVHVRDLASAHVAALASCQPGRFAAYNLGTGTAASIGDVLDMARRITGRRIPAIVAARRVGDAPLLIADASLAANVLGWRPVHSQLSEVIASAWRWMTQDRTCMISGGRT